MSRKFVLVIDGGGSWGVLPAKFCETLENSIGVSLREKIDLFVGTSTGALICSALNIGKNQGSLGLKAEDVYKKYKKLLDTVYKKNDMDLGEELVRVFANVYLDPQFTRNGIQEAFQDVFDDNLTFRGYKLSAKTSFNRLKLLAIVSYELNADNPLKVFKSWKQEDEIFRIIDALIASSSVPSVHPPQNIDGRFLIDGGLLAENPILIAVQCVYEILRDKLTWDKIIPIEEIENFNEIERRQKIFKEGDEIHFISVGTGFEERKLDTSKLEEEGQIYWAKRIAKIFLKGQHGMNNMFCDVLENMADENKLSIKFHRFDYNIQPHLDEFFDKEKKRFKKGAETNWDLLDAAAEGWSEKLDTDPKFNDLVTMMRS